MIHGRQIPPAAGRTGARPDARVAPTQRPPSTAEVGTERLETPRVGVQRLSEHAVLPAYAHAGDAGLDLVASEPCMLATGERRAVPTGLALAIPVGWVGLVHPRSGLALRHGLTVANAPGTIDAGYRGEVRVILVNLGADPVEVCRGERIAQLVLQRVGRAELIEVDSLDDTDRGAGGFGSTGTS